MKKLLSLIAVLTTFYANVCNAETLELDISTKDGFQEMTVEFSGNKGSDLLKAVQTALESKYNKNTENYFIDVTVKTSNGFLNVLDDTDLSTHKLKKYGSVILRSRDDETTVIPVDDLPKK